MTNDSKTSIVCQDHTSSPAGSSTVLPERGPGEGPAGEERSDSLLYLYSNNTIGTYHKSHRVEQVLASCGILSPYHKRQAHALFLNADRFVEMAPSLDQVGFLTITTPDNCTDYKDLYKRWNSFNSNFLKKSPDFIHYMGVKERQDRGALHLHLLVQVNQDIRTGFDWELYIRARDLKKEHKPWRQVAAKCYRSATPYLNSLWTQLREELPKYGFGRSELLPIRSNVEALARYVGGYLGKHVSHREERDKGMRLTFADRGWIRNSCRFAWATEGGKEWREKTELFAAILKCATFQDLSDRLGKGWAFKYAREIYDIRETWKNVDEAPF